MVLLYAINLAGVLYHVYFMVIYDAECTVRDLNMQSGSGINLHGHQHMYFLIYSLFS